jgi:Asp/Glu/hydantoin racemase
MTPDKPYIEEDLEKFAELIVRGCAGLCDINDKEQGNILREHFGVEE